MMTPLVFVLAGGRGTRMGGRDKSRLPAPDTGEALAARIVRLSRDAGLQCALVGGAPLQGVPRLADDPPGIGPIGAFTALLQHAADRPAIAIACDLPHVTRALIERLAREHEQARILAPRDPATGKWQPLFARYEPGYALPAFRAAIAAGTRSMQTVLQRLEVTELPLCDEERRALRDWDSPSDLAEG